MQKEMKASLKDDPTQSFTGKSNLPMFNGSKPAGLLCIEYVFKPALHGNTFEKGVNAEYALDKHEYIFEEARKLKKMKQPGCCSCGCCMKYTCATVGGVACVAATGAGAYTAVKGWGAFKTLIGM